MDVDKPLVSGFIIHDQRIFLFSTQAPSDDGQVHTFLMGKMPPPPPTGPSSSLMDAPTSKVSLCTSPDFLW
jgi:hypothetical protein